MAKKPPDSMPEKYPRKVAEGPRMDYDADGIAYPKPKAKPKKRKGWGKK